MNLPKYLLYILYFLAGMFLYEKHQEHQILSSMCDIDFGCIKLNTADSIETLRVQIQKSVHCKIVSTDFDNTKLTAEDKVKLAEILRKNESNTLIVLINNRLVIFAQHRLAYEITIL